MNRCVGALVVRAFFVSPWFSLLPRMLSMDYWKIYAVRINNNIMMVGLAGGGWYLDIIECFLCSKSKDSLERTRVLSGDRRCSDLPKLRGKLLFEAYPLSDSSVGFCFSDEEYGRGSSGSEQTNYPIGREGMPSLRVVYNSD